MKRIPLLRSIHVRIQVYVGNIHATLFQIRCHGSRLMCLDSPRGCAWSFFVNVTLNCISVTCASFSWLYIYIVDIKNICVCMHNFLCIWFSIMLTFVIVALLCFFLCRSEIMTILNAMAISFDSFYYYYFKKEKKNCNSVDHFYDKQLKVCNIFLFYI